jgi:hypothetical protein
MAIGALGRDVLWLILRDVVWMVGAGVALALLPRVGIDTAGQGSSTVSRRSMRPRSRQR